ncbi:uncharacterized protein G2W53_017958 [Senna tora]|uniref:Uncharacterized protein n=1 Tax=Senna tora TaxID=362788 RepID=A0A834TS67_9FABA|nr:uncharacterized protein G2W53_017958 [Senna tora]
MDGLSQCCFNGGLLSTFIGILVVSLFLSFDNATAYDCGLRRDSINQLVRDVGGSSNLDQIG